MRKLLFSLLAIILVLSTVSCSPVQDSTTTQTQDTTSTHTNTNTVIKTLTEQYGQYLKADTNYNSSPDVDDATLQILVDGNNAFAFDLYKQLISASDGNIFYSPYSISLALAMTYAEANGQTEEQMADVLHFLLEDEELHAAFNKLAIELNKRNTARQDYGIQGVQLNIANAIWGQQDYEFMQAFLNVLAENYDAGMRVLDYQSDPEACRKIINDWVSEQTNGKIKDLIPAGGINSLTRLVLTNAVYFKATWMFPFEEEDTYDDTFYLADGITANVPMMHQTINLSYKDGRNYRAVELPYDTNTMSMVLIVPDEGSFADFENSLTAESILSIVSSLDNRKLNLTMPRFKFEYKTGLKEILPDMGMTDAFSSAADFSGMTGVEALFIADVLHKAWVSVDEKGTEAAAATAVMMAGSAPPKDEPFDFTIDRPFIFLIMDNITDSILFIGRVVNPAE
jgi:serpin B